jgi:hypothetical protein
MILHTKRHTRPKSKKRIDYTARTMAILKKLKRSSEGELTRKPSTLYLQVWAECPIHFTIALKSTAGEETAKSTPATSGVKIKMATAMGEPPAYLGEKSPFHKHTLPGRHSE